MYNTQIPSYVEACKGTPAPPLSGTCQLLYDNLGPGGSGGFAEDQMTRPGVYDIPRQFPRGFLAVSSAFLVLPRVACHDMATLCVFKAMSNVKMCSMGGGDVLK